MDRQTLSDLDHALGCFEKAFEIEPASALGRAYFASTAGTRLHFAFDQQLLEKATQAAQRAVELNPNLPEAHRALAGMAYYHGDLARTLDEAYQCIELGGPEVPTLARIGHVLKALGQPDRALIWFEKMAQWRQRPAEDSWMIGDCWSDLADDKRAEANYRRVFDLNPDLPQGWLGICRLRCLNGDFAAARAILSQHSAHYGDHVYTKQMAAQVEFFNRSYSEAERLYNELAAQEAGGGGAFYGATSYRSALGWLRIAVGDEEGGERILQEALEKELHSLRQAPHHAEILYRIAAIESSLGYVEMAVLRLRDAFSNGWIDYRSMDIDPRFDRLRDNKSYQEIFNGMRKHVASLRFNASLKDAATN